jgi:hypothetical protein
MDNDYSDDVMNRLAKATEKIHKRAMAKILAHEKKMDAILDSMLPRIHPFEYNPKKPSLHP